MTHAAADSRATVMPTIHFLLLDQEQKQPEVGFASSISQYGVTWRFDKSYPAGQFVNGDWWVVGPVVINQITPSFDGSLNGWQVNPSPGTAAQGYDSRLFRWGFNVNIVPRLPYSAAPGDSIVKGVSGDGRCTPNDDPSTHPCYLDTVAVLTVLEQVPPNNGATVFRPSFMGNTQKVLYSTENLRTDLLPSLAPAGNVPPLSEIENNFKRVQLDYSSSFIGRYMHPAQNMSQYGSNIGIDTNQGALRLMLNDPLADKMPALIAYIQAGIDWYHMFDAGANWSPNGGHQVGRKLPIIFAAVMLNNQTMKTAISKAPIGTFSEDGDTYYGQNGVALYGRPATESQYWMRITANSGARTSRDPYGYVDGGGAELGGGYQYCCTAQPYKGAALAARLLPEGMEIWNHNALFDYADRWVEFGAWASPDPCELQDPINYSGSCFLGNGRWTDRHGTNADAGNYRSPLVDSMWAEYRGPTRFD